MDKITVESDWISPELKAKLEAEFIKQSRMRRHNIETWDEEVAERAAYLKEVDDRRNG